MPASLLPPRAPFSRYSATAYYPRPCAALQRVSCAWAAECRATEPAQAGRERGGRKRTNTRHTNTNTQTDSRSRQRHTDRPDENSHFHSLCLAAPVRLFPCLPLYSLGWGYQYLAAHLHCPSEMIFFSGQFPSLCVRVQRAHSAQWTNQ